MRALQGYRAHKKANPPQDLKVGRCLGPGGGLRGVGVSCERDTSAAANSSGEGTYALRNVGTIGLELTCGLLESADL